jgi:hypothetical protein
MHAALDFITCNERMILNLGLVRTCCEQPHRPFSDSPATSPFRQSRWVRHILLRISRSIVNRQLRNRQHRDSNVEIPQSETQQQPIYKQFRIPTRRHSSISQHPELPRISARIRSPQAAEYGVTSRYNKIGPRVKHPIREGVHPARLVPDGHVQKEVLHILEIFICQMPNTRRQSTRPY